jgi:phosphatidylglycerol:prolipoprotein diacylglycerol transferase
MFDPIALKLGLVEIRWYGVLIAVALVIGSVLAFQEVRRKGLDEDLFLDILLVSVPSAFIGARLYYVLFNLNYFINYPFEIPAVWHGGLAIHGGLIGAFLASYLMIRHHKLNFWLLADCSAPSIVLGQAIGRWGNYFNQEAYGYSADPQKVPWAMWIAGDYRHPTFLYESVWDLLIFMVLLLLRRKSFIREGEVFLLYFIFYSLGRLFIERFRTDSLMLGHIRVAQLMSFLLISIGVFLLFYRRSMRQKHKTI